MSLSDHVPQTHVLAGNEDFPTVGYCSYQIICCLAVFAYGSWIVSLAARFRLIFFLFQYVKELFLLG